ncbi:MAG: DUF2851 family protein [Chitinophagaceae bacterium]|nr:MAG: DUF2851 family protein [Chitinophagaceae bacterium]
MTERLLQFIWQFQYFNKTELTVTAGEDLNIIFPGGFNTNQGPDFSEAKIKIGKTTWVGNIELHIKTSDWKKHNHDGDKNYNNVILHVVWEDDDETNTVPILELKQRVSKILLSRYEELMSSVSFIPCKNSINTVKEITWQSWKERLMAERLTRKAKTVETYLQQNNYHWEETFWWLLARNFGMKVNAEAFEQVAKSIPVNILAKHKTRIHQLEALLLGQAGLLDKNFKEDYPAMLKKEYRFLKSKYLLQPINSTVFFLRMRPSNFPTIRLAQLAALVQNSAHLFSKIKEAKTISEITKWFDITANDYWNYHYRFEETSPFKKKKPGMTMISNIVINTVAPVLFAYGQFHNEQKYKDKALRWLEETAAETNSITKGFQNLGIENKNARDSQALIELKNEYCGKKRCLDCAVGNAILKS